MPDRSSWLILLSFIVLFIVIGYFTSFTHSYISALSYKKLSKEAEFEGASKARKMLKIADNKEKLLGSLKCMNTFLSISFGVTISVMLYDYIAYMLYIISDRKTEFSFVCLFLSAFVITIVCGFIYYLFAVSIPENVGFKGAKNESGNYRIYPIIKFICVFSRICVVLFFGFASLFNKKTDEEKCVTEEEILQLVDKGEESGGIESVEKELIENIFDFSDLRAGDVMTHRTNLAAIDIESTNEEILALIEETEYSRYPVYKGDIDSIVGILNAKRFFANLLSENKQPLENMIFKPYLVPESIHGDVLLEEMQKRKTHMAVVVDEYGGTCGIVTMEDLLERIVGNIYDETDDPATETEIIKIEENLWKIAGSAGLDTICNELNITIEGQEELDFDTLGGLVFSCLTVVPEDQSKTVVDAYGLHIEVELMGERRVEWALVSVSKNETVEEEE